jgi:endonuclease YncB( thermonuclease family)
MTFRTWCYACIFSLNIFTTLAVKLPQFSVVPGSVYDGDTIRVIDNEGMELRIRLACIDAPERKQPGGIEAQEKLREVLEAGNNQVKLNIIKRDRYGRSIAEVWSQGELVQLSLISQGLVYAYEKYKEDCPSWEEVEAASDYARLHSLGVWNNPEAIAPWDYRKQF